MSENGSLSRNLDNVRAIGAFLYWAWPMITAVATAIWQYIAAGEPQVIPIFLFTLGAGIFVAAMWSKYGADLFPWKRKSVTIRTMEGDFTRPLAHRWDLKRSHIDGFAIDVKLLLNSEGRISNKKFTNCSLIGPVVIEPVEAWPLHNCYWDASVRFPKMFQAKEDVYGYGQVLSEGVDFRNCTFDKVLFRAPRAQIDNVIKQLTGG